MSEPIPKTGRLASILLTVAALVIIFAAMRVSQEIIRPFLLSLFFAIIASTPVTWLIRKKMPRALAVAMVAIVMIALLLAMAFFLGSSLESLSQALPQYLKGFQSQLKQMATWTAHLGINIPEKSLANTLDPGAAMQFAYSMLGRLSQLLSNVVMIMVTVVLLLLEAATISTKFEMIQQEGHTGITKWMRFMDDVKNYIAIKTLTSLLTGCLIGGGLWLLGVDNAVLWGMLAFMLNYIPNIGSIVAAVPAVLIAWAQFDYRIAAVVAVYYVIINTLVGFVLEPHVMGRGLGLSTLVVFLSLVFWGWLLGPVGMLLSVLLTMLVKYIAEMNEATHWLAVLLSATPKNFDTEKASGKHAL